MTKHTLRFDVKLKPRTKKLVVKLHRIPKNVLEIYDLPRSAPTIIEPVSSPPKARVLRPRQPKPIPIVKIKKETKPGKGNGQIARSEIAQYQNSDKFKLNVLVFAKVNGYRTWPAIINDFVWDAKRKDIKKYNVEFFGTKETASVNVQRLHLYCAATHAAFGIINDPNSRFGRLFTTALTEIRNAYLKSQ